MRKSKTEKGFGRKWEKCWCPRRNSFTSSI